MPDNQRSSHRFGGKWTDKKLHILAGYLAAYTTALRGKPSHQSPFKLAYIDGFAGSGSRSDRANEQERHQERFQFTDFNLERGLLDGSARIALKVSPPFDTYIFIEKHVERCNELESMRDEFPEARDRITILNGDANEEIQRLCRRHWAGHRAVLFLDPYGMQVEWRTIEAVAGTGAIDLWLLYPLWMGVNRLLPRSGEIPPAWRQRLNQLLGEETWYDEFYRVDRQVNLFGDVDERVSKVSTEVIGQRFVSRLQQIFPGVSEVPGVLRNTRGYPLYLLCFAASNKSGAKVALKIAGHLLKGLP